MMRFAGLYLAMAVVFAALDFCWLTFANTRLYRPEIGSLLADKVRIAPAIAFYLIYMLGAVVFAAWPGLKGEGVQGALLKGALFGLVAYATYDLTCQATMKVWSIKVTLADMAWGAFATAVSAALAVMIVRPLIKA